MVSTLTGKRLSFKTSLSDNLSLQLQETGIKGCLTDTDKNFKTSFPKIYVDFNSRIKKY